MVRAEQANNDEDVRHLLDTVVMVTATPKVSVMANYDYGKDSLAGMWQAVQTEICRLLSQHRLDHVTVERGSEPPEQSAGGKYRTVIPLH